MELLFKVLLLLGLSTFTVCMQIQLPSSLKIQAPLDLHLGLETLNTAKHDKILNISHTVQAPKNSTTNQCFCFPNSSKSLLVTDHPDLKGQGVQRLVVYFYKKNGLVKAFIPNMKKQALIPDLTFDEDDGDKVRPIHSEPIRELFENVPNVIIHPPPLQPFITVNDSKIHTVKIEPIVQQESVETPINIFDEHISTEEIPSVEVSTDTPTNQFDDHALHNDNDHLNVPHDLGYHPELPVLDEPINNSMMDWNTGNLKNYKKFYQLLSTLPPSLRLKLLLTHHQLLNPEFPTDMMSRKFEDWLKHQLSHLVLQNLRTYPQILAFKHAIEDVLKNSNMSLSNDDILFDSNGNVVNLDNLKLRPVLIGDLAEHQKKILNHQTKPNYAVPILPIITPFHQMVMVTQLEPPKILGSVPVGKVYLPTDLDAKQQILLNEEYDSVVQPNAVPNLAEIGCKTCISLNNPYASANKISYLRPLGQNAKNGLESTLMLRNRDNSEDTSEQPHRRVSINDINTNNIMQKLMEFIDLPKLLRGQSRRLLGGNVLSVSLPTPRFQESNEEIPGFRIVGGNAATSSGTPIVSKGRSGTHTF